MKDWINIETELPEYLYPIIFYSRSRGAQIGYRGERGKKIIWFHPRGSNTRFKDVTHWMPVPEPPKS